MFTSEQIHQLLECLKRIGFPSDHKIMKALHDNKKANLNTCDENGFTPLRIAIQKQDNEAIKLLYLLEPNPKHLSDYDKAYIDDVVFNKKEAMKDLLVANHRELICCIQALYSIHPGVFDNGICFGIAHMRRQAFFSGETDVFRTRLKNIKANLWPIIEKTMAEVTAQCPDSDKDLHQFFSKVRVKLENKFPFHIWYDLYAFFDGAILAYAPRKFPELFAPETFLIQNNLPAEPLIRPIKLEKGIVPSNHIFSGHYTQVTLPSYFECLDNAFKNFDVPISFQISTGKHVFIIDYFRGKWIYTDSNHLEEGEKECNSKEIASLLLKYYSDPLICSTRTFITPEAEKSFNQSMTFLKKDPIWIELHEQITKEKITQKNSFGHDLLFVAATNGDIETVRHCLNAGAECTSQGLEGFTPLHVAIYQRHLEIVKELLNAFKDKGNLLPTNTGITPLYVAAQEGLVTVVEELLKNGSDLEKPILANTQILLSEAKKQHREEKLRQLFDRENIGDTLPGFTPLHAAVFFGHRNVAELLQKNGAKFETPTEGISIYKLAVAMNRTDLLSSEIQENYEQRKNRLIRIKPLLENYQNKRKKRFYFKDKLSPKDKKIKEQFIKHLTDEFNSIDLGNQEFIKFIEKRIKLVPGIHFRTTLYQVILELVDKTPDKKCSNKAQSILKKQKSTYPEYVTQIEKLYNKIEAMQDFGKNLTRSERKTITTLAAQLKKDLDFFISQHPKKIPDKSSFKNFRTKFNARLHSQDVLMRKQEIWNAFALNLFLAVTTLGIALGVKAIHSKLTTGQVTFFHRETKKQKKRNEIKEAIEEIKNFVRPQSENSK
jgi:ankyrin repeat protein